MAKDVLITPLDGIIQFSSSAGTGTGQVKVDGDDLVISNLVGDVLLGDGASDVFIGNGTDSVDIVFEQNGEIRDDGSSKTITIGSKTTTLILSSSSDITMQGGGGNVGIGTSTATKELEVAGDISASGDLHINGNLLTSGSLKFPTPSETNTNNGIVFFDTSSNAPNTKVNAIKWDFSNDDAFIYAHQSSSDGTYLVNELSDNTSTDKFVWWFNNYAGANTDSFPLMMEGNKFVVNYIKDRRVTFHRDNGAVGGNSNNVDFYLLKSGSSSVSTANSLIHGDVSVGKTTLNDIVLVDGNLTASGDISASGTLTANGGTFTGNVSFDDKNITNVGTIDVDSVRADTATSVLITLGTGGIQFNAQAGDTYTFNTGEVDANFVYMDSDENELIFGDAGLSRVGISDTSPVSKLDVGGDLNVQSHITASGNISASGTSHILGGNVMINSDSTGSMTTHKGVFSVNYGTGTELTGSLTSTGDGIGKIVKFGGTTGLTVGRIYHLNSSGGWTLCGETGAVSSSLLAVAMGGNSDVDGMLLEGFVRGAAQDAPVAGQAVHCNAAGRFQMAAPSDAGDVVRIVGYAVQTGLGNPHYYFNPDSAYVVRG